MFIKGIAIFLQFILLQSANEIKAKRATLLLLGHPHYFEHYCKPPKGKGS